MHKMQELRQAKGLTQGELGDLIGVSRQAIGNYERGDRQLDPVMIGTLCDYFGVTADYLLGRSDVPTPMISDDDWRVLDAYHRASLRDRELIDRILEEYKSAGEEKETAG